MNDSRNRVTIPLFCTIFLSALLSMFTIANAAERQIGRYQGVPLLVPNKASALWVVDTATGRVRICRHPITPEARPRCQKWSPVDASGPEKREPSKMKKE